MEYLPISNTSSTTTLQILWQYLNIGYSTIMYKKYRICTPIISSWLLAHHAKKWWSSYRMELLHRPTHQPNANYIHSSNDRDRYSALPSRSGCTDVFRESLDRLDAALGSLPPLSNILVLGDFNVDPRRPYHTTTMNEQGRILLPFMERWNLVSTHLHRPQSTSTHTNESDAHSTLSIIDHIVP